MTTWSDDTTRRIGEQIRLHRRDRSAQWLSDRTAELGHPISRTAVSEYETGKRKSIPVTDLMVLSAALEIPPIVVIFPKLPDGDVEALPAVHSSSITAAQWFSGEGDNPSGEPVDTDAIAFARQFDNLKRKRDELMIDGVPVRGGRSMGVFESPKQARRALELISVRIESLRQAMRAEPGTWTVEGNSK